MLKDVASGCGRQRKWGVGGIAKGVLSIVTEPPLLVNPTGLRANQGSEYQLRFKFQCIIHGLEVADRQPHGCTH